MHVDRFYSVHRAYESHKKGKSNSMAGLIWNNEGALKKGFLSCLKDFFKDFNVYFIGIQLTI